MGTNPIENLPVRSESMLIEESTETGCIPHDKMQNLDNLVSLIDEANQKISEYTGSIGDIYIAGMVTGISTSFAIAVTSGVWSFLVTEAQVPVVISVLGMVGALAHSFHRPNHYDSSTNILNIFPRLVLKKHFKKKKKEYLALREKRSNGLRDYKEIIATAQDKIASLLSEINEEMDLGTSFLSYDATKNVLELANKHEYKSPALRQIILSGEILEKKQNNYEGTHKSIEQTT